MSMHIKRARFFPSFGIIIQHGEIEYNNESEKLDKPQWKRNHWDRYEFLYRRTLVVWVHDESLQISACYRLSSMLLAMVVRRGPVFC